MMGRGIVAPGDPEFQRIMRNPGAFNRKAHEKSDVDSGPMALHHTLGWNAGQAAPGDYVRSRLVGEWKDFPSITAPWIADSLPAQPKYRIVNGILQLSGRLDYGSATPTASTVHIITTIPGITKNYTGSTGVTNSSNQTASTAATVIRGNLRLGVSGELQLVTPASPAAQRWLHFDGVTFEVNI